MPRATTSERTFVPIDLGNGVRIKAEVTSLGGRAKVGLLDGLPFEDFTNTLSQIASSLAASLRAAAPDKASVELGVEMGLESGKLTALIVKGTGTANLKVTLEWSKPATPKA